MRLHDVYARSRRDTAAVERCSIAVERIAAPMLLVTGEADVMWPAAEMATLGQRQAWTAALSFLDLTLGVDR